MRDEKKLKKLRLLRDEPKIAIFDELTELNESVAPLKEIMSGIGVITGKEGKKGDKGDKGDNGRDGKDGRNGKDGKDGKDGYTPKKGKDYFDGKDGSDGKDGLDGVDGIDGIDGEKGDKPDHKWEGTKLKFEKPNGRWGKQVDLKGEIGKAVSFWGSASNTRVKNDGTLISDEPTKWLNFKGSGIDAITNDGNGQVTIQINDDQDLSPYLKLDQTTPQTTVGTFTFPRLKMTTGATNGYVLTSDADGLASWEEASGGAGTLAEVSAGSDDTAKSLYTMSTDVDVNFVDDGGNSVLYLDESTGNVGIGTTGPTQKLEVLGRIKASSLIYSGSSYFGQGNLYGFSNYAIQVAGDLNLQAGSTNEITFNTNGFNERMRIDSAGNVGIGTTNPSAKLDVDGKVALSGTTTLFRPTGLTGTLIVGNGGTNLVNTTGTNGFYNLFIGDGAGQDATVTTNSVGLGYNALANVTSGIKNMAIGADALLNVTTGYNNIAIGESALRVGTTMAFNTAIGTGSMYSTTGSYNTAIGNSALSSNTSATSNTAIGANAMAQKTTGAGNVAIGYLAGYRLADLSALTTATGSVFIGNDAKALANSGSNEIVIGYNATGIGSNTVTLGNDDITTTALKGNVGIGTTEPTQKLEVLGRIKASSLIYSGSSYFGQSNLYGFSNYAIQVAGDLNLQAGSTNEITFNTNGFNEMMRIDSAGNVGIGTTSPDNKLQVVGDVKIGEDTTNYAEFEEDGTLRFYGTATVFKDELQNLLKEGKNNPNDEIVDNFAEGTIDFKTTADIEDYAVMNIQFNHGWKIGSDVFPHIHWFQNQDANPNWLIQYRWQKQGEDKTTAWTNYELDTNAFTYTTGTLNQISHNGGITPPTGAGLSDILQVRLIRDTGNDSDLFTGADAYTGNAEAINFDVHYECDSIGSDEEYTK